LPDSSERSRTGPDPRPALSLFYATHFGHMAIVLPFLPLWIHSLGYPSIAIGLLLALIPLAKLVAPWTWGRLADRTGMRRGLLVGSAVVAAVAFLALGSLEMFAWLLPVMALYAFALSPGVPFVEATALEQAESRGFAYGRVRLWGSLAFVGVSAGYGAIRDVVDSRAGFYIGAVLLILSAAAALRLPRGRVPSPETEARPWTLRGSGGGGGGLWTLLAACVLMQVGHGPYYAFYSIRLEQIGYGGAAVGGFWALAVISEVVLLTRIDSGIERLGTATVLRLSLVVAAIRWLLIAIASGPLIFAVAQVLHAMTYAAFHVAALREVFRRFDPANRATGQALYSGLSYGLGIFLGNLLAGALADRIGLPSLFAGSAAVPLVALLLLGKMRPGRS
jgi:PPP family 3-phenylpropionic acid transporter